MQIPQDVVPLKERLLSWLRRRHGLDRQLERVLGRFTTYPADDFARFTRSAEARGLAPELAALPPPAPPQLAPAPESIAPGTFEVRFADLQARGDYDEMWELLAEDAQRAWGGRERFVDGMRRQAVEYQLLDARVSGVDIVPEWTDGRRNRTYRNVARLAVRYRIRHGWREVAMDRQVHLVPAAGGWRTLFYPV